MQIQIYPQTYMEPKYGAFNLKNEVSAHGLVLMVQLSWRVAPPLSSVIISIKLQYFVKFCLLKKELQYFFHQFLCVLFLHVFFLSNMCDLERTVTNSTTLCIVANATTLKAVKSLTTFKHGCFHFWFLVASQN